MNPEFYNALIKDCSQLSAGDKQNTLLNLMHLFSELGELEEKSPSNETFQYTLNFLDEEVQETKDALKALSDLGLTDERFEELIDGFCDVAFIAINGVYKCYRATGMASTEAPQAVLNSLFEVAVSNYSKYPFNKDQKGKIMKPEGFVPPSHTQFFNLDLAFPVLMPTPESKTPKKKKKPTEKND